MRCRVRYRASGWPRGSGWSRGIGVPRESQGRWGGNDGQPGGDDAAGARVGRGIGEQECVLARHPGDRVELEGQICGVDVGGDFAERNSLGGGSLVQAQPVSASGGDSVVHASRPCVELRDRGQEKAAAPEDRFRGVIQPGIGQRPHPTQTGGRTASRFHHTSDSGGPHHMT